MLFDTRAKGDDGFFCFGFELRHVWHLYLLRFFDVARPGDSEQRWIDAQVLFLEVGGRFYLGFASALGGHLCVGCRERKRVEGKHCNSHTQLVWQNKSAVFMLNNTTQWRSFA